MKQYITSEQYLELSDKARKRLKKAGISHTPNIGQMIGFLDENFVKGVRIEKWSGEHWHCGEIYNSEEYATKYESPELCNALWEAVKEVLNSAPH